MNDREKLIDILESAESAVYWNSDDRGFIEKIADHLIANGVTVSTDNNDGCKYCTEYADLPERFVNGEPIGMVFDSCIQDDELGWHLELPVSYEIGIQFCPCCGRRLPEPPKGEQE